MQSLSFEKAGQIKDLAVTYVDAYRADHKEGPLGGQDLAALVLAEDIPEWKAFKTALLSLSLPELKDLVALMYVGRGDHVENENDPANIRAAFEGHRARLDRDDQDSLTTIVHGKNARFHGYFERGITRMKLACA
jgi:hypothetical protein